MTITKGKILTDVNENLQTNFSASEIATRIQAILNDLSEADLLVGTDDTQTLVNGDTTLAHPTGFRALVAITLTVTSSSSEQFPLIKLKQGHAEYRGLRHGDDTVGIPRWFSDFNDLFFLWRPPNQAFTSLIEFYKDHPQDVDNIEFGDMYQDAIFAGVTWKMAIKKGRARMITLWGAVYADAKQKRIDSFVHQPRFVRGN